MGWMECVEQGRMNSGECVSIDTPLTWEAEVMG